MKIRFYKPIFKSLTIFLILVNVTPNTNGQETSQINYKECCFNYISTSLVRSTGIEELTVDPFYKWSNSAANSVRFDIGAQMSNRFAIEFGYSSQSLWLKKKLIIDEKIRRSGGMSNANISYSTLKFVYNLPLISNKVHFTSGLGYALGKSSVPIYSSGPREPVTTTLTDVTFTESNSYTGLHSGSSHFITMDLGLEFLIFNRWSIYTKASYVKGFKDLQEQTIAYSINGIQDNVTIKNDGSFVGLEIGLKFKFYPHFLTPITNKVLNFLGAE